MINSYKFYQHTAKVQAGACDVVYLLACALAEAPLSNRTLMQLRCPPAAASNSNGVPLLSVVLTSTPCVMKGGREGGKRVRKK